MDENNQNNQNNQNNDQFKEQLDQQLQSLQNSNKGLKEDLAKLKKLRDEVNDLGGVEQLKEILQNTKERDKDINYYKEQLEARQQELEKFKKNITQEKVNQKLKDLCNKHKGSYELLENVLKQRVHVEGDYNDLQMEIRSKNNEPLLVDSRQGNLDDLMDDLKQDPTFSRAFDTPNYTGSGASQSHNHTQKTNWEKMTLQERMKMAIDHPQKVKQYLKK